MFFEFRPDRVNAASAWRVVIRTAVLCMVCIGCGMASARDNVRLAMQLEPPVMDPTISASASIGEMTYANVYEGLTVLNGQGQIQPRLATAWTVAPDRLSYEFTLRKNVTFHDGQAFNAQTALYSIKRMLQPELGNPQRMWFDKVADVEAKGPYTLTVRLKSPDALLPFALALPAAAMVHPSSAESNREKPVGTGPYRFVSWAKGDRLKLQRYPARRPPVFSSTGLWSPGVNLTGFESAFGHKPPVSVRPRISWVAPRCIPGARLPRSPGHAPCW
jgi:peptide/nickel transport system substrate-binding protein